MKNLKKIISITCLITICFLLLSESDGKAQLKKMSAKDLTEESSTVLYGKCKKIKSEWNENKSLIFTYITIQPEAYIKGNLGSEVVIVVPGGRVGDILNEVSETPFFTENEEIVAFIWTNPTGKNLITGGPQGKIKIEKDEKTGKRSVVEPEYDEKIISEAQVLDNEAKHKKVDLDEFVNKLKGYAKN